MKRRLLLAFVLAAFLASAGAASAATFGTFLTASNTVGATAAVDSGGATYVGQMQVVPSLTDQEAADVLSYVLTALNGGSLPADAKLLDAAEFATRRADGKAPTAVAKSRQAVVRQLAELGLYR